MYDATVLSAVILISFALISCGFLFLMLYKKFGNPKFERKDSFFVVGNNS